MKDIANDLSFTKLISPISPKVFFEKYWEKGKPLILADRNEQSYADLIQMKDIDYLISTSISANNGRLPWLRMINNKKEQHIQDYLRADSGCPDMEKIMSGFRNGDTIILNELQRRFEPIRKLAYDLEETFGHRVRVNMYLTPLNAQGFKAHYDSHDVFILQIEGKKLWKIYDHSISFPLEGMDVPYSGPLSSPIHEIILQPGDLLYVPRGLIHEALTKDTYSLHLTVGIMVCTWIDLIHEIISKEVSLRKALPRKALLSNKRVQIDPNFIKQICSNEKALEEALNQLRGKFSKWRTAPSFSDHLTLFTKQDQIEQETLLKKRGDGKWRLIEQGELALIQYKDQRLRAPLRVKPLLEYIMKKARFSVQSMPGDVFSEKERLLLIRHLFKGGLIDFV